MAVTDRQSHLEPAPLPFDAAYTATRGVNLFDSLRGRLQGTVIVHGEIVSSDPELWSDGE